MYNRYNRRYTRDYYDDDETSSDEDSYDTPLAQDMSKTDRQIAELLYNLNHVNDKPQSKISEAARKKRAENLAKAREVRMNKLKGKKDNRIEEEDDDYNRPLKANSIRLPGDDDPFKSDNKSRSSGGGGGLKIPPPNASMPGDNAVMPVYF